MNKLDFRKHCEKKIEQCIKLNDAKHLQEHELALAVLNENERLIQENKKYKKAIDKIKDIDKHYIKGIDVGTGDIDITINHKVWEEILKEVEHEQNI